MFRREHVLPKDEARLRTLTAPEIGSLPDRCQDNRMTADS